MNAVKNIPHPAVLLRTFGISACITIASLIVVLLWLGAGALGAAVVLIAVELAFSFDNAIINAKVLARMNQFWQKMFLTVGVVLAIFGMRVLFPMIIVMLTAHVPFGTVVDLAFNHPTIYAAKLTLAHPSIAAFGGSFLLMLALHFFMDDEKEVHWITEIERPLKAAARWWVPAVVTVCITAVFGQLVPMAEQAAVWRSGLAGTALFLAVNVFTEWIGGLTSKSGSAHQHSGTLALMMFGYLQLLDASFSFDSVLGAFAITTNVVLIAIGLGVGAIWVRSLTVYMVRHKMLSAYAYLEHGAHYAVLALAVALFISLLIDVPQAITGIVGIGLIAASVAASPKSGRRP